MPLIVFGLLAGFSDNKCLDRQGPLELKFFKIFIWIRGTLAKDTHLSIHTVYKFHNKMIMQVPWTFCEKNYLLSLALKPMTFQLMCSCQGINFLAGISISPINHSVPIGSQYPGGPSKGHKFPIIRVSFTYCAELPGPPLELKLVFFGKSLSCKVCQKIWIKCLYLKIVVQKSLQVLEIRFS